MKMRNTGIIVFFLLLALIAALILIIIRQGDLFVKVI
jgi:hypothetical protein